MVAARSEAVRADTLAGGIQWNSVVAGAVAAAAVAFVLHSFAIAAGLAVSSPAPTWRDASFPLVALSGLYLVLTALASYGLGGYVAARVRRTPNADARDEVAYLDGMHGLLTWGLATLLTALVAIAAVQALPRLAAPSGGGAGPAASVAGENIIAFDLDRLFRGERRPQGDTQEFRSEAARILLTVASHEGMRAEDRAELVRLVSSRTGLSAADADRRVTEVSGRAKANIDRARRSAVLLAFMTGAAALLGAAAAWFAAMAGGGHRDDPASTPKLLDWGRAT